MKNFLATMTLCVVAFNANAITFNETTSPRLDTAYQISGTNTHWDTTTGLEWLDFGDNSGNNVTFGWSLNNAYANYGQDGFRLANETEVFELFDLFFPSFADSGDGTMVVAESETSTLIKERNSWLVGFGTDVPITGGEFNTTIRSAGIYQDDDGTLQLAGFKMDPTLPDTTILYSTEYVASGLDADTGYKNMGIFMVREYVPAVPIPTAVWLFASGLIGLVAVARRKV